MPLTVTDELNDFQSSVIIIIHVYIRLGLISYQVIVLTNSLVKWIFVVV